MDNIEKALQLALETIDQLDNGVSFELRTVVCLKNLKFWWSLDQYEQQTAGLVFKEKVMAGEIPNIKYLAEYSDKHNWYMKTQ